MNMDLESKLGITCSGIKIIMLGFRSNLLDPLRESERERRVY